MTTLNNTTSLSTAGVEFDKLSSGVDRILERWSNGNKPTRPFAVPWMARQCLGI